MAATGSGGMAILRWLTGKLSIPLKGQEGAIQTLFISLSDEGWIPPLSQLLRSRAFGAYVLVSAASGAAATYLYDDRSNPKVNTLIKVCTCLCACSWDLQVVRGHAQFFR
eukprot:1151850-Pelagomonas_calceolata.AAC.5